MILKCRICGEKLKKIIKFNKISLVGNFNKNKKKERKYPISLNFCIECYHVQIGEVINSDKLFKNYFWETGVSKTNLDLFKNLIKKIRKKINKGNKILEIASNDGSFLKFIKKKYKCTLVGVDPAMNLAKKLKGIKIIRNYYDHKLSKILNNKIGKFDFIFARNVIAHVPNPNTVFKGISENLNNNGIAILEFPHLQPIIKKKQYDNIFHEHRGYHSIKSILDLCKKNNLYLVEAEKIESQGGSLRCQISKNKNLKIGKSVNKILNVEVKNKLFNKKKLMSFEKEIKNHKNKLHSLLNSLKKKGKKISIYGASGKVQALMQFCEINNKLIDYVFDKSKLKINRYTPGTNIKILHPKFISKRKIDYILLLTWNLKKEIIKQEKRFLKQGGKIILPFPQPHMV